MSHPMHIRVLESATFKDAQCSPAQQLASSLIMLDTCTAATSDDTYNLYGCTEDGTFKVNTFHTANCTGTYSQYSGLSGECVENMAYTFSRFTCITSAEQRAFKAWQVEHSTRDYAALSAAEARSRFEVWRTNTAFIAAHNAGGESLFSLKMNAFGDLTREEWRALHRSKRSNAAAAAPHHRGRTFKATAAATDPPPAAWDWRVHGAVSTVKNQFEPHSCGSCWAFSAIAGVESRYAMNGNTVTSFSAQNLIDCTLNGTDTCNAGGEMHDGVEQIAVEQQGGVSKALDYKYTGFSKGVCHYDPSSAVMTNITGYVNVSVGDEVALLAAVATGGVIPSGINSEAQQFMFYSGGILDIPAARCKAGPNDLDHGVAIVGYGESAGTPFWIVKNSYGLYWGEKGYFRIVRGRNSCGIATDCIVVTS